MPGTLSVNNGPGNARVSEKHELIPDFLIIGAGKCGTTSLDKYLKQHPEIFIPARKEPNFYGYENTSIDSFGGDADEIRHFTTSITTFDKYIQLFTSARANQVKGETSNTYMYHPQAPERIRYYNRQMKLIAILRQPANRLYSRYLHLVRDNRAPTGNFADCLDQATIWWRRNDLIREGFYYRNLSPFYKLFPKKNIRVYLYEDLNQNPESVLADIFGFLGVDTSFQPDFSVRYNQSGIVKNKFLDRLYGQEGIVNKTAKAILPESILHKMKNNIVIQRAVNDLRSRNLKRPRMDHEIKRSLTLDVYGDDIRKLQSLIGKDLQHWLAT